MMSSSLPYLASVDGRGINCPTLERAVSDTIDRAKAGEAFTVFTLNLDHLVKMRRNPLFSAAYANAGIVTADGAPVAWLARAQNSGIERTTGADLVIPLADAAAHERLPVFLFGTSAEVMARAGRDLNERTDGLIDIAGTLAPSSNFDPEGPEADAAIETIRRSGAKLVFVALGAPKQEIFAERARQAGLESGLVCIGAALDFIAGTQIRAPQAMRDNGLEWIWRLATNPRRLFMRYAQCGSLFLDLILLAPLRQRATRLRGI
ncbi:MAG: WecB/TagA/CpsF family glycosyltransferase [Hyphomicrobiaceae bacterium]|nr:WecB/TagA/CpsF family glycosyltransferase [Hyphomicrobiaceae bacterium]